MIRQQAYRPLRNGRSTSNRWLHRLQRAAQLAAAYLVVVLPSMAWAADGDGVAATSPDGLGNLLSPPPGLVPAEGKSLFEFVGMEHYFIWTDLGVGDVVEKSALVIYAPIQLIAMLLVRLGIAMSWWLDRLTAENNIATSIGSLIESSASLFNTWLLPTALAVGALIAYGMARRGQNALSQIAAVIAIGLLAVGLASSGGKLVSGLDTGRSLLSNTVGQATGSAMNTTDAPIHWYTNYDQGTPQQQLARKSGDTIWRTFAVTMWCESQFGSVQACEQYGPAWLKLETDDERKAYVEDVVIVAEGGGDAATVRYMQGHQPSMRITVALFSLVLGAGAGLVIAGLSMVALLSWILALLLLALAGFFAAIMVIPGRPRRWGLDFFNTVIAATIGSALVGGLLWATLAATGALAALIAPLGFLPMAVIALAVLLAGWKSKSLLEGLLYSGTSMRGQGDTGMRLASFIAAQAGIRTGKRATRAVASAGAGIGGMAARGAGRLTNVAAGTPRHGAGSSRGAYRAAANYAAGVSGRREAGAGPVSSLRPAGRTDPTGSSGDTSSTTSSEGTGRRPAPAGPGRRSRPQDHGRYTPNRRRPTRERANEQGRADGTARQEGGTTSTGRAARPTGAETTARARGRNTTTPGSTGAVKGTSRRDGRLASPGEHTSANDGPAAGRPTRAEAKARRADARPVRPSRSTQRSAERASGGDRAARARAENTGNPDFDSPQPPRSSRFVTLTPQPRTPGDGRPPRRQPRSPSPDRDHRGEST